MPTGTTRRYAVGPGQRAGPVTSRVSPHEGLSLMNDELRFAADLYQGTADWQEPSRRRPDHQVLSEAGFEGAGRREFTVGHRWSLPELAGYVRSTSFLPVPVLAAQGAAFDADLAGTIEPFADDGTVRQAVWFACAVARRPAAG
jgi:hypothetical protein